MVLLNCPLHSLVNLAVILVFILSELGFARPGCLTGGLGPGQLVHQSCDCDHMTRIPVLHTSGCQAMPQDARLGCLTGGLGPGQLVHQSCDCDHMTRILCRHSPGPCLSNQDIDRWRCDCDRITRIPGLNSSEYHTNPLRY